MIRCSHCGQVICLDDNDPAIPELREILEWVIDVPLLPRDLIKAAHRLLYGTDQCPGTVIQ